MVKNPSFRTYGVYPFPLFFQENGIHHSFFCSVTSGSGDTPRKGGATVRWWWTLFFPWHKLQIASDLKSRSQNLGAKKSMQTFFVQSFSRTLRVMDVRATKIVDVRTKKCVFLRPRWWGETFWPQGIRAEGSGISTGNPDRKVYVYAQLFSSLKIARISPTSLSRAALLKFRRVTIPGAQPSARLSEEILPLRGLCGGLSRGLCGVSPRVLRGLCGVLRGSAGFSEGFRGLVTLCLWPSGTVAGSSRTFTSRDLWFEPLFNRRWNRNANFWEQVRTMSSSEKVHTVSNRWWFAIRDSSHKSQSQSNRAIWGT